jgi:hypothetical protein
VWDELMKIRLQGWQDDASSRQGKQRGDAACSDNVAELDSVSSEADGLIGFFEEQMHL